MKDRDLIVALLYDRYRQGQRIAPTPRSPALAGVMALFGIVVTVVALGALLAVFAFACSVF